MSLVSSRSRWPGWRWLLIPCLALAAACGGDDDDDDDDGDDEPGTPDAGGDDVGADVDLPDGFTATVFAQELGRARHIAVTPAGDVFVAIGTSPDGSDPGRVIALRDGDGDGVAETRQVVAERGGNGIWWADGQLFVGEDDRIVKYPVAYGQLTAAGAATVVVTGLPATGDHRAKTVVVRGADLFVNIGSATNSCQVANRTLHSPGIDPCPELDERAGVWRFSATATEQTLAMGTRFSIGTRNANALDLQPGTGALWTAMNGRDQLHENWPEHFTAEEDQLLPAEGFAQLVEGGDYGWPYCYFDPMQNVMVLAPEYGGDGMEVGRCTTARKPEIALPAHWAPLGMDFYDGTALPERYRGGAFVATHGSRFAPESPGEPGYNVVFVPFSGGAPVGTWEVFADGFAGSARPLPAAAAHRPLDVAESPDGALYVSDDHGGFLWKIRYGAP
jgi:glucose/arabinose dehydrogenase